MEAKERTKIVVGGLILITLGVLILMNSLEVYGFGKSWPILLIVIAIGILIQRSRDVGGWFIGIVGFIFLIIKNWYVDVGNIAKYILPLILIVLGILMFFKKSKRA